VNIFSIRYYKSIGYVSYLVSVTTLWFTKFLVKMMNQPFSYHKNLGVTNDITQNIWKCNVHLSQNVKIYLKKQLKNIYKLCSYIYIIVRNKIKNVYICAPIFVIICPPLIPANGRKNQKKPNRPSSRRSVQRVDGEQMITTALDAKIVG
jgi:hypothetical protein